MHVACRGAKVDALQTEIVNSVLNGTAVNHSLIQDEPFGGGKNANHVLRFPQKSAGVVGKQQALAGAHKSQSWLHDLKRRGGVLGEMNASVIETEKVRNISTPFE